MKNIEFHNVEDICVIKILGKVDIISANTLKKDVFDYFVHNHPKKIILNFEQLKFVSSYGFRIFIEFLKACQQEKVGVALCSLSPNVHKIGSIIGFNKLYKIFDTQEQAIAYLHTQQ